ncbi:hypothetical protein HZS_5770 [Henneguya salminicola]|nr:hypothetical protein HZS_5770 [Henneguya salminicola]
MSTEKSSSSIKRSSYTNSSSTETRCIDSDENSYTISLRDNNGSRILRISKDSETKSRTTIDIPMSATKDFADKLNEIAIFLKSYTPKNISQRTTKTQPQIFPLMKVLTTITGRKYYMDVYDAYDMVNLIITSVYRERRYSMSIVKDVIPKIEKNIRDLLEKYPPILQDEEIIQPLRRGRQGHKSEISNTQRTLIKAIEKMGFSNKLSSNKELLTVLSKFGSEEKRSSGLVALTDPPPIVVEGEFKEYKFEMVDGEKTFLRITERIHNSRKAALHIPLEMLGDFINGLIDFNESIILEENKD